ncbi:MAG: protein kinase [Planctomycetaceae bacterium]
MNSPGDSKPDPLTVYCGGCNAAFAVAGRPEVCPRCGMHVAAPTITSIPTLLFRSDEFLSGSDSRVATDQDVLSELAGNELGNYDIKTLLGRGGMGWVYLARHRQLGRPCALKILSPHLVNNEPEYLSRFHSEGQAAASLVHPNIVTVHAIGEHEGLHFLEMEFLPGHSLQGLLRDGRLPPFRAASVTLGIAHGLAAAHRQGVLHRDLKPDNVLLAQNGLPKLADFGLCKRLHAPSLDSRLAGTPHFMAPELFSGSAASKQSDVYSLGVCMFSMLAGHLPFSGVGMNELIRAISHERTPSIRRIVPDVPLEVAEVVGLMLDKTPANRPRDGIEAVQLLQAVLGETNDLETILREALTHEPHIQWNRVGSADRFQADVLLPDGRRQMVYIEVTPHNLSDRLVQIYSTCCQVVPEFYYEALKLNSMISHGAISIRRIDEKEFFVIVNSYPRSTIVAEELRRSILEIAQHADSVELKLTGLDIF